MNDIITIKDLNGQILFSCDLQDQDKAFQYALELEELDIDFTLEAPSLPETLIKSLGSTPQDVQILKNEIEEELNSHLGDNCCN